MEERSGYGTAGASTPLEVHASREGIEASDVKTRLWSRAARVFLAVVAISGAVATIGRTTQVGGEHPRMVQLTDDAVTPPDPDGGTTPVLLVDPSASRLTKILYQNLQDIMKSDGILFGHQMTNWFGQHFSNVNGWGVYDHSDVNNATGDWPVMFGYEFLQLLEGQDFTDHAIWAFQNGAIVNFYWEAKNPVTGGTAYDGSGNPIVELLPGGSANAQWTEWMDTIADFLKGLTAKDEDIPVVLRIFHEASGFWFWWGAGYCTADEFKAAWKYTIQYLRDVKGVHNLIYAYAPAKPSDWFNISFQEYYPGDDWVDVISWDRYDVNTTYRQTILDDCAAVVPFAFAHNKVVALGETGIKMGVQNTNDPDWFDNEFLTAMEDSDCKNLAYALTYTNYNNREYWVPLPGQTTYPGFLTMYKSQNSIFLGDDRWQSKDYYQHANATCCDNVWVHPGSSGKANYFDVESLAGESAFDVEEASGFAPR